MAREFFQNLFRNDHEVIQEETRLEGRFPNIDPNHMAQLVTPVLDEEIKEAIFEMKPYKAPGPDGYQRTRSIRPRFLDCLCVIFSSSSIQQHASLFQC